MAGVPSRLPDLEIADAADPDVSLAALARADLPRIGRWLREPHVARWWDDPPAVALAHIEAHLDDALVAPFLARALGRPVGYLQIYHANPEPFWAGHDLPRETFGLDLFIGEGDMLGRGWGPRLIALALRRLFAMPEVARVQIDPSPANEAAIRAYGKAGFRPVGEIQTPDGPALYMMVERVTGSPKHGCFWTIVPPATVSVSVQMHSDPLLSHRMGSKGGLVRASGGTMELRQTIEPQRGTKPCRIIAQCSASS